MPNEDTAPTNVNTDADDRWVVRKVGAAEREMALQAARRAHMTMGEWLGQAIRAAVAAERGEGRVGEVLAPPGNPDQLPAVAGAASGVHVTIEQIGHAVDVACKLAEATQKPPSRRLVAQVNRMLMNRLG